MKFGQKIEAKRRSEDEWEVAVFLCIENDHVAVGFQNGEAKLLMSGLVRTRVEAWRDRNREKTRLYNRLYQRQRRARRTAEKLGISIEEVVYRQEQRRAVLEAKKDPAETRRRYWRDRQRAHREKKAETDGE
jgi:hypothetical protein